MKEQGFQLSGCTTDECIVEVGKLIGVRTILVGNIGKIGKLFTINVRLVDVETGRIIRTATDDCECPVEQVLTNSTQKIAQKLIGSKSVKIQQAKQEANDAEDKREIKYKKFYLSPMIGYGFDEGTKLGYGGRAGYRTSEGVNLGLIFVSHQGSNEKLDGIPTKSGESWYLCGEVGYLLGNDRIKFNPNFLIGIYDYKLLIQEVSMTTSGNITTTDVHGSTSTKGEGFCVGIGLDLYYLISKNFYVGAHGSGILGADGGGLYAMYFAIGFNL